jgi:molybdate transport system ATP-binding protein
MLHADVETRRGDFELALSLRAPPGEVVAVLGPNGAGKTTLLRTLAGLQPLERGRVALDGEVLDDPEAGVFVPPERRPLGIVFQDYLLFPHLDVLENVAFGLRCRGRSRGEARAEAGRLLEQFGLTAQAHVRPARLSGGQQQRVALARALAGRPRMLLLDEPLSALDVSTRAELRRELKRILDSAGGVRLLVTHDPLEARILADRLVIVEQGRVVQTGTPAEVTARPRSTYVSRLVGVNLLRGRAAGDVVHLDGGGVLVAPGAGSGDVLAVIHPTAVALHRTAPEGTPRNVWQGVVAEVEPSAEERVRVRIGGARPLVAEVTPAAVAALHLAPGSAVWVSVKATEIVTYPA